MKSAARGGCSGDEEANGTVATEAKRRHASISSSNSSSSNSGSNSSGCIEHEGGYNKHNRQSNQVVVAMDSSSNDSHADDEAGRGTALHEAVAAGDVDRVLAALSEHPCIVGSRDVSNKTPLQVAVVVDAPIGVVNALLHAGAAKELTKEEQVALLQQAVANLNTEVIEALAHLERPGATALHIAAVHGCSITLTKLLLLQRNQVDKQNPMTGETPLLAAVRHGAPSANVAALLLAKASLHLANAHGSNPLESAIFRNNEESLACMLWCCQGNEFGQGNEFVLNGCSIRGGVAQTLLTYALTNPDIGVLKLLLKAKADPTKPGMQHGRQIHSAPLFTAVMHNNTDFIASVARICGVDALQAATDHEHGRLLHAAIKYGHLNVVKILLESKCDVDHESSVKLSQWGSYGSIVLDRATALHLACYRDNRAILELLLKAKANPTVTQLQLASERCNLPILELLLEAKADPTIKDARTDCTPRTALIAAVNSPSWHSNDEAVVYRALELLWATHMKFNKLEGKKRAKWCLMVTRTLHFDLLFVFDAKNLLFVLVHEYTQQSFFGRVSAGRNNQIFCEDNARLVGRMAAPTPLLSTEEGTAVLHAACIGSHEVAAQYLLEHNVNPHLSFPDTNDAGRRSQIGDLKTAPGTPIHDLLETAMACKTCSNHAKRCRTLHGAVQAGHPGCIRHLAASKASVDFKAFSLHSGHVQAAKTTALGCAVHTASDDTGNGLACAQALLECKADPNAATGYILKECIHVAGPSAGAWIRLMVSYGADVSKVFDPHCSDRYLCRTALHYAVECTYLDVVTTLLGLGASPKGVTALAEEIVKRHKMHRTTDHDRGGGDDGDESPTQQAMQIAAAIRRAEQEFEEKTKSVDAETTPTA